MSNMTFGANILPANGNNSLTLGNSGQRWNAYISTINGVDINEFGGDTLPEVSSSDNGKVLSVNDGQWEAIEPAASSSISVLSLIAVAGSWTSATPPTQILTATGVTANSNIIVGLADTATSGQYDEACDAKLLCTAQALNSITLTCYGIEPTENIPITVVILG